MIDYNDIVGTKIDRLFIRCRAPDRIEPSGRRKVQYLCDCTCGSYGVLRLRDTLMDKNKSHSCGCETIEKIRQSNIHHGDSCKGKWNRLYRIWSLMKDRCTNSNTPAYKDYGGRGISVCDEWMSYERFRDWAYSNGYQDHLTIDRIDNDGNYCPDNCHWITIAAQMGNRRFCRYITINDVTHHMSEWSRIYHIRPSTISARIHSGWDPVLAVTTPVAKRRNNAVA